MLELNSKLDGINHMISYSMKKNDDIKDEVELGQMLNLFIQTL